MPPFPRLLHRLLCIPLPPRPPPKPSPHAINITISHPYNARAALLSSYRRATPPRRRPTRFTRRPPTHNHNPLSTRCSTLSFTCAGLPSPRAPAPAPAAEQAQVSPALYSPTRPDSGLGTWPPAHGSTAALCRACELLPALPPRALCTHCADKAANYKPRARTGPARPVSEAWTISAYERDSFCGSFYGVDERDAFCGPGTWGLEEEEEEGGEGEGEGRGRVEGGLDSPTLPAERCFTGRRGRPPLVVVERGRGRVEGGVVEEVVVEEVGSIDFTSSYYGRLYRDWISVS
ncbi:hypothetical protein DFP73DRAFT_530511 [Morchella snyderi]|nr:hypothetical protein DFP73DRAFT_530511 [Morchella snyderi]